MGDPVVHFEILGKDTAKLRDFYAKAFDWQMGERDANDPFDYAMVSTQSADGGIVGGIGRAQQGDGAVTFYLQVDDLEAKLDQIAAAGGRTIAPPLQVGPTTTIAMFSDPEGHVLGLMKK